MLGPHVGPGQDVEQGGLARVRVADDRRGFEGGAAPACPLLVPLGAHLLDLPIEIADPLPDTPAFDLDLLLAESTAGPHSPSPSADLPVIGVRPDQPGQQVMEPSRLNLESPFVGAGVVSKDLEDDLGPIQDARLDLQLEVALLARAEVLVADHHVELAFQL